MKSWVKKIADQFDLGIQSKPGQRTNGADHEEGPSHDPSNMNDERATLLFILDILSKNLIDIEHHPVRKTRDLLDGFAKSLLQSNPAEMEKLLFRIRQFYSTYRLEEYSYLVRTMEEFKSIIWDFADQLGEDLRTERAKESELKVHLNELREAVEANSIEKLKSKSREFIDTYVQYQSQKDERRSKRLGTMTKTLGSMKKQLSQAQKDLKVDHLSQAYNRRSFDEQLRRYQQLYSLSKGNITLLICDIDHFKKVNDTYGHDIGDHVIKECVRFLKEAFPRENDFVARLGGEEFAVILPDFDIEAASKKIEACLNRIRHEKLVHEKFEIKFTVSVGVAQLMEGESFDMWLKRADMALYQSKNSGRDRYTVAPTMLLAKVS